MASNMASFLAQKRSSGQLSADAPKKKSAKKKTKSKTKPKSKRRMDAKEAARSAYSKHSSGGGGY